MLTLPSIVLLRRMAQSTTSIKTWVLQQLHIKSADLTRKPRSVWHNPIAWREAKTKASAAKASLLRYGFIAAGDWDVPPPFPTFADGHREVLLCEAILKSHRERCWVDVAELAS